MPTARRLLPFLVLVAGLAALAAGIFGGAPAGARAKDSAHTAKQRAKARRASAPAYPSRAAIAAAVRYLDDRTGRTSLAVLDSSGRLSGARLREHFQSASVVKVMFLTAFLQRLAADHAGLSALDRSLLYPMIHESNNDDASAVLERVGLAAVARVAREAGMQDYAPGVGWWAYTQTSAADQARFFIAIERLIPRRFWPYARGLMDGIEAEQSWGIPEVARPRWQVFFKTGALPSEGLFNETARLERPGVTFTVSIFSTGDPSQAYGEETMRGVGAALLAGTPPR
ncbi:MAG TPA: serine hydrolase [Solirubrobacteraceae bacterium]